MEQQGKISEWNEATLKIIRLHEIQGTINLLKMDPLKLTDGIFNYVWLEKAIDSLYGEGYSKYTDTERKKVDKVRKLLKDSLKHCPPHKKQKHEGMGKSKTAYLFNEKNYEQVMDLCERFERLVKDYNDDHGLTTKNQGHGGLF